MKLVSARKGPWELYNLDEDPTELNNLIDKMPETTQRLKKLFEKMLKNDGFSEKNLNVNDFIAPWGTRSYGNKNLKAGDVNKAEQHPVWKYPPTKLEIEEKK